MSQLFIYLIKANIALTLFYLAYRFGLRRLTFYTLNRYFLLFGMACSALFPLADFRALFQAKEQVPGSLVYYPIDWNALQSYAASPAALTIWDLLSYIFWVGVAIMAVRFALQLISLLWIHLNAADGAINNEKVKLLSGRRNPFSFFNQVYINPHLHAPEALHTILAHEKIHIRGWHTLDVLAGEINHIFYWFNPGAWLLKKAIRENLEFITDRQLLQSGINAKKYQYTLLNTISGLHGTQLANNFNLSHLKKRIVMMNKDNSSRYHLLRYLALIPVTVAIAIIVTSARGPEPNRKSAGIQNPEMPGRHDLTPPASQNSLHKGSLAGKHEENTQEQNDTLPVGYKAFIKRNPSIETMEWVKPKNGKGPVAIIHLENGKTERYPLLDSTAMKAASAKYGKLPAPPPPPPPLPPKPKVKYTPPRVEKEHPNGPPEDILAYANNLHLASFHAEDALYIIDGKEVSGEELRMLKAEDIHAITVLKSGPATSKYGNKAKSGVIMIETKKSAESNNDSLPKHVLYIIDNREADKGKFKKLDPDDIYSISVLKDEKSIKKYGAKGKNGVIIIHTKDKVKTPAETVPPEKGKANDSLHVTFIPAGPLADPDKAPLFIVNNQVQDANFSISQIKKSDLYSIDIVKGKKAAEKYGVKNKNGVVKVFTKNFIQKHPQQRRSISSDKVIINN